jgi:2-polyprenyl-6-methoxyphenol hydroxylase-like FAD-dependent oxidoreductase
MIIGGGLGGLCLAQYLKLYEPNIRVVVYERDEDDKSRGQGYLIGLNGDGHEVMKPLGERIAAIRDVVNEYSLINDPTFLMLATDTLHVMLKVYVDTWLVSRFGLRDALRIGIEVQYNKRFSRYEENDNSVTAYFEDGTSATADVLIGGATDCNAMVSIYSLTQLSLFLFIS